MKAGRQVLTTRFGGLSVPVMQQPFDQGFVPFLPAGLCFSDTGAANPGVRTPGSKSKDPVCTVAIFFLDAALAGSLANADAGISRRIKGSMGGARESARKTMVSFPALRSQLFGLAGSRTP